MGGSGCEEGQGGEGNKKGKQGGDRGGQREKFMSLKRGIEKMGKKDLR